MVDDAWVVSGVVEGGGVMDAMADGLLWWEHVWGISFYQEPLQRDVTKCL